MLQTLIRKLVRELKKEFPEIKEENFQFPGKFGDISCNICFIEAKKRRKNPSKIAEKISKKIKLIKEFGRIENKNGYLNFYFNYPELIKLILKEKSQINLKKENVMVEFSNPNPCKAMHIGNSRSTFIGDSLSRILEYCGKKVIRANYYNDLGKQVAKTVLAVKKYGLKKDKKIDHELAEIYAKLHAKGGKKEQEELNKESQKILYELENKTGKFKKEWKEVIKMATKGFEETYKNSGVKFNVCLYESDFKEEGKKIAGKLLKNKNAFPHEGAVVINLEKEDPKIPNTILIRSDGTGVYLTSDLALTIYKFKKFKLNKSIWVVGADQNTHFKQLFKIMEILGYKWAKNCEHVSYGLVTLKGSKMSSRSGEFILIDSLIDEIIEKAVEEVRKRNPDLKEKKVLETAKKVGLSALKYDILKVERNKNVDFNPNKAIRFEGDTGPYIQYTIVRCNSILKKSCGGGNEKPGLITDYEKELIRKFIEFQEIIKRSAKQLKPNLICNYAFELATVFSRFYENCKVVGGKEEKFRIKLVLKTKEILEICLNLLGIEIPERM